MRRAAFLLASALVMAPRAAAAVAETDEPPRVLSVQPSRDPDRLLCRVRTAGLPSARAERSLLGGLPSTVDFALDLLDARERVILERHLTYRLAFDLWDEFFSIEAGGQERRFADLEAMRSFLAVLDALPVAPIGRLAQGERYRIRVGLLHHPIAPSERGRVGEWLAGEDGERGGNSEARDRDSDGREVSFGLGSLIRLFYRGGREGRPAESEATSASFRLEELPDESN